MRRRSSEERGSRVFLSWWLAPIAVLLFGLLVWSNHFQNQFHGDDFSVIVNNRAIRPPLDISRFFTNPRTFSADRETVDYRPLLSTSFALDAWASRANDPAAYQLDGFFWFGLLIFSLYGMFRLVPGTSHLVALFAAALVGLHPISAETVNYISQRGQIMGAAGVTLALVFWIVFPRRLPQKLGFNLDRVPQTPWQDQIRKKGAGWERKYKAFLQMPVPFYLIPLVPALLAEPSAAVFALLLLVYTALFDSKAGYRRLALPALICAGYWLTQTIIVWRFSGEFRVPSAHYWFSQPWVAMHYLLRFLLPVSLSANSGLKPLEHLWSPECALGVLGTGLLAGCAIVAGRRPGWRGVAFGIWWFLIGLAPAALIPQRTVEANPRMFFASAGLAFALASLGRIGIERIGKAEPRGAWRGAVIMLAATLAVGLPGALGGLTWQRNQVWETELSLWQDATQKSPRNARAFISYAVALASSGEEQRALENLLKAALLTGDDGPVELSLAQGFDRLNRDIDAEFHFRRALFLAPWYPAAYSSFSQWLFAHRHIQEAFAMASKGLSLNPSDIACRRTLIDIYSERADWARVEHLAKEILALDPEDAAGKRSQVIASAAIDQVHQAEADVKTSPTVDEYLKLSVLYYHNQRYEDCVKAAREALRLRPNLAEAYANMASAFHTMGRNDEAIAALREVIRLRPDMKFAKNNLEALLDRGDEAKPGR